MKLKRILIVMLVCSMMLLTGCSGKDNVYSGIEKQDLTGITTAKELEYIYEYREHTDNWASSFFVYQKKNSDEHTAKLFLKYIGTEPSPSGELKYMYTTESGSGGNGILTIAESDSPIYNLGSTGGNGSLADQDSVVELHVEWNGVTEDLELQPVLR